jgi:hypothetical protein
MFVFRFPILQLWVRIRIVDEGYHPHRIGVGGTQDPRKEGEGHIDPVEGHEISVVHIHLIRCHEHLLVVS